MDNYIHAHQAGKKLHRCLNGLVLLPSGLSKQEQRLQAVATGEREFAFRDVSISWFDMGNIDLIMKDDVLDMRKSVSLEQATAAEQEVAKLQGAWRQLRHEIDGIKSPRDEHDVGAITTFSGNNFTVQNVDGSVVLRGTFSVDASVSPKAIDWIDSIGSDVGKILPASYKLDGDSFIFIAGNEGAQRPTEFATKIGETMRSFVRERAVD